MAQIITRTYTAADKKLVLANEQWARQLLMGSTWSSLRIGVRLAIDPNGNASSFTLAQCLAIGVCSGTSNVFGDASCTHFFGAASAASAHVYAAGPPASFNMNNLQACRRVVATNSTASMASALVAAQTDRRTAIIVDITKGTSPTTTFTCAIAYGTTTLPADCTDSAFYSAMETTTMANVVTALGANYTTTSTTLTGVDEPTAGTFNSVYVGWKSATRLVEISDIAIARLS